MVWDRLGSYALKGICADIRGAMCLSCMPYVCRYVGYGYLRIHVYINLCSHICRVTACVRDRDIYIYIDRYLFIYIYRERESARQREIAINRESAREKQESLYSFTQGI